MTVRVFGPMVIVTWSASFASSSCENASSQNVNDAFIFVISISRGHLAFTESAVVSSSRATVAFFSPNWLQKM